MNRSLLAFAIVLLMTMPLYADYHYASHTGTKHLPLYKLGDGGGFYTEGDKCGQPWGYNLCGKRGVGGCADLLA